MGDIFVHTGLNRCFTQFFYWHFFPNMPYSIQYIKNDDPLSIAIHKLIAQQHSLTSERKKLVYNKKTFENPFFIAYRNGIRWR